MVLKNKVLSRRQLNKEQTQTTVQFNKSKGTLTKKDLKGILTAVQKQGKKKHDYFDVKLIRVLNGDKWITFYDYEAIDEYYEGKVKDTSKFEDFSQVQVTLVYE